LENIYQRAIWLDDDLVAYGEFILVLIKDVAGWLPCLAAVRRPRELDIAAERE
jgi:hypothetical protein